MKQRPRIVKDKKVRAFVATVRAVWGFERVFKSYIHSEESGGLWAYVRHLSQNEIIRARQVQNPETTKFVIAYSPKITTDLYLEYGGKTFKVVSIDPFEYNKTDLTIRAEEVSPPTFDEVEYEEAT